MRRGMHKTVDVHLGADILGANRRIADENRAILDAHGIVGIDFLGAIGSGKTILIEKLLDALAARGKRGGVIAGDVAGDDDYRRFRAHGVPAHNLNTGKECHLDAHLVGHALEHMPLDQLDVLFIENVGNLVCPADFPLGSHKRVVVISVTEGDDMVRKHPLIFTQADVIVVNKVDVAGAMEVHPQGLVNDAYKANPNARIVLTDAKHGIGLSELYGALGLG